MHTYEVFVEQINPCGGSAHSKKEVLEIEAESPQAYVQQHGRWPVLDTAQLQNGDLRITTGDCAGNKIIYTFSE